MINEKCFSCPLYFNSLHLYLLWQDEENSSYPTDLESIVSRQFVFKLQVSAYNVNNNYHIFTVNKLTDDKVVMKLIGSKQTEEEVFYDPICLYSKNM